MIPLAIGVHLQSEPERLRQTLAQLRACTPGARVVLLPDAPDEPMRALLGRGGELPPLLEGEGVGAAACFNRLLRAVEAELLIFLESGALVGPGWAEILAGALAADPAAGLVGPSTNRAWNEQAVFPQARGGAEAVARTAGEAWRRFGKAARTLEPLYSLGDFCYGVRRAVVEAIGGADEGFGRGPCWEMEYSARAARAGWRGLWACGAYVYRSPVTARRAQEEAEGFEASRRLYQDRLCGRRLRGEGGDYAPHCRGDACAHFAPAELVRRRVALCEGGTKQRGAESNQQSGAKAAPAAPAAPAVPAVPAVPAAPAAPLVSCIMPTRGRPAFVQQSIALFARQSYAPRELIIVDEAGAPPPVLPPGLDVRVIQAPPGESIGAKRNRAIAQARGAYIAQWDDDDWYAPERLAAQMAPLLAGRAEVSALQAGVFFELPSWQFWSVTPALHRRLFLADVHGGTLVYARAIWEQGARYPARSLAEDAAFLRGALQRGARLASLPNDGLFVYLRHGSNSWSFRCGDYLDAAGWQRAAAPPLPPEDWAFYRSVAQGSAPGAQSAARPVGAASSPLVSCIMPTADRRAFVPQAIAHFQRQSYAARELIIVDDGRDPVADLIPADPAIRYMRLERRRTIGAKRNLAAEQARGAIILHWDDDDWMAAWRIAYQVERLEATGADGNGLARLYFWDVERGEPWLYAYPSGVGRPWVAGATLCYRRAAWQRAPFPDVDVGEDARFVWGGALRALDALTNPDFYVARIHRGNTAPKPRRPPYWSPWPGDLRALTAGEIG